jgi:hypothetical protein
VSRRLRQAAGTLGDTLRKSDTQNVFENLKKNN